MAKPLRIFVSSPGDVDGERRRAGIVIAELRKAYARFFDIEPILWEWEPMLASGHFQDQITPPSETDIVVVIVWSRLGTPLPPKTQTREYRGIDGRVPVTGTEWEFEDALAAQKLRGAPDLLAYRKHTDPLVSLKDKGARIAAEEQWEKLEAFWSRWFVDRGEFRAAFGAFADLDDFEAKLKSDLRKLIERRIQDRADTTGGAAAPTWLAGSPFRGLDAYRFEHAPIFFGRSTMVRAAVEQLTANAEHGRGFLLILGASGSGKSSLAQAGLVPALADPGVVTTVGLWRRAVFRPGGHREGPFAGLAEALAASDVLPELVAGRQDTVALARHLKGSVDDPAFSIVTVLDQIEDAARARGQLLTIENVSLVLVVDQLEELFTTSSVTREERTAFIRCLDGLAKSGRIYVLGTMRNDYWHRAAETPLLVEMASGDGRLDLLPATQDEIIEMIRRPAEAAGIELERDPSRDVGLDATLATEAASEPGALPLLSFLLDELYKADISEGRTTFTFASMSRLGGLRGAIATRAEAVFAGLPVDVQAALPRVLRGLVTVSRSGAEPTARTAALAQFAESSTERRLVDALLNPQVRLLVADGDGEGARVRLAHEALLTHWERAKRQIAQDQRDLETRDLIERQRLRWQNAAGRVQRQLLLRDPDLANALDLARRWGEELDGKARGFIGASARRARRVQQLTRAAAVVFALLGAGASILGVLAVRSEQRAAGNFTRAEQERAQAEKNLADAQVTQSRFLADLANQNARSGDIGTAILLAIEALPNAHSGSATPHATADLDAPISRPFVPEANDALLRARAWLREIAVVDIGGFPYSPALSPDRRFYVVGTDDGARVFSTLSGELITVLRGHRGPVYNPSFSSDGRLIMTASQDGTARLWDAGTGRLITVFTGHTGPIYCVSLSPDGRRLVTGSQDKTARIWDTSNAHEITLLRGHSSAVNRCTFSPDGKQVLTASNDKTARLWDANTGELRHTLQHRAELVVAKFSPSGNRILTASWDSTARIWDADTGEQLAVLKHGSDLSDAEFNASGQLVVTASHDYTARIWDVASGRELAVLQHDGHRVFTAVFSSDDKFVLTGAEDAARIWNVATKEETLLLSGHLEGPSAMFGRDDSQVLTVSNDRTFRIWDVGVRRPLVSIRDHSVINSAAFDPDGRMIVTASEDHMARIWDASTGSVVRVLSGHRDSVLDAAFSPDGRRIVTASADDTARIWDVGTGETLLILAGHSAPVTSVMFSRDGERIVTGSRDGTARIWQAGSGKLMAVLKGGSAVFGAKFSPDGRSVIAALKSGVARIWDVTTGQILTELKMNDDHVVRAVVLGGDGRVFRGHAGAAVAFNPKGDRIVTANGYSVVVWDAATGAKVRTITDNAVSAVFSPDGRRIVTGSWDGNVHVWDVETGARIFFVASHDEEVTGAAFSPDGRRILTSSKDASARIWRFYSDTQDLVSDSKRAVPRCLTSEQRKAAFLEIDPPAWCIQMRKWPYQGDAWQTWLKYKKSKLNPPPPYSDEWAAWLASHRLGEPASPK